MLNHSESWISSFLCISCVFGQDPNITNITRDYKLRIWDDLKTTVTVTELTATLDAQKLERAVTWKPLEENLWSQSKGRMWSLINTHDVIQ